MLLLSLWLCVISTRVEGAQGVVDVKIQEKAYQVWMLFNQARMNPAAVLERLHIDREAATLVLGDDAWLLDQGLAPLAWDGLLQSAADGHAVDMINRLYYAHLSPEGVSSGERVAATGYQAQAENEVMAALIFTNPFPVDEAVDVLVDNMLRDELTGTGGQARAIFSPLYTEVGLSFRAETLVGLAGQPYVYLLVANFAQPLQNRTFIMGSVDPRTHLMALNLYSGVWIDAEILPCGFYQIEINSDIRNLFYWDVDSPSVYYTLSTQDYDQNSNSFVDLRQQSASAE